MASPRRRAITSPALAAFGRQFRRYREHAGLSQARVGQRTGKTASFVSQVESGKKRCKREFVEIMDPEVKAGGVLLALYDDLNSDGHLGFPSWFDWPEVEVEADVLTWWEHTVIPGLLQKESYARAFLGSDEAVAARMARQEILTREVPAPTTLVAFISEHALTNLVGSREIMREQLEHLIVMSELPNVTVQIVVNEDGVPAGTGGAFIVATMKDRSQVAYLETTVRGITTDDENDLSGLARTLRTLGSKALPANMSREFIRKVIEAKWT
ncbi:helix-turn-helix domain-containing protein [Actinomadura bangladeshensis]|uniref:Helix-turn-helix domain-containing protein n=1 Tax=Actinomadura bangladeshensis TaxID=453573 RepID=A0A6L9QFR2_9ACTN|nr:helix-turn-helix transcriptional regulator [Actinomadura bangladeshensis]NEA23888.1 helix-turn-helix domain-containing protein [Actinomadura bangladeshensis]